MHACSDQIQVIKLQGTIRGRKCMLFSLITLQFFDLDLFLYIYLYFTLTPLFLAIFSHFYLKSKSMRKFDNICPHVINTPSPLVLRLTKSSGGGGGGFGTKATVYYILSSPDMHIITQPIHPTLLLQILKMQQFFLKIKMFLIPTRLKKSISMSYPCPQWRIVLSLSKTSTKKNYVHHKVLSLKTVLSKKNSLFIQ